MAHILTFLLGGGGGGEGPPGKEGKAGAEGPKGTTGAKGEAGGNSQAFTFSKETAKAKPAAGLVRLNNATVKLVTEIYASTKNFAGTSIATWMKSVVEGTLRVYSNAEPGKFATFTFTAAATEAEEFLTLKVVWVSGEPAFAETAGDFVFDLEEKGKEGKEGPEGKAGSGGEYSKLAKPFLVPVFANENAVPIVNQGNFVLTSIPATGHIKKIWVPNGSVAKGNIIVGVYDLGVKTAEKYSRLAKSASTAQAGTIQYQAIALEAELAVTAGEFLYLCVVYSEEGKVNWQGSAQEGLRLPEGTLGIPAGIGKPFIVARHAMGAFELKAELGKAEIEATAKYPALLAPIE